MFKRVKQSHNHNLLLFQGILNIFGALMAVVQWHEFRNVPLNLTAAATVGAGIFACYVALSKPALQDRFASFVFLSAVVPVYGLLWAMNGFLMAQGKFWEPFQPHELSSLTIAILAPPYRSIGVLAILLFPILAGLQFFSFTPEQLALIPSSPLFAPIAFGVFALVLYFYRLQGLKIAGVAAEVRMMKKLTRSILAIKDLANSPIQALIIDAELLQRKHPEAAAIAERIEISATKLGKLNHVLDSYGRESKHHNGHVSFDSKATLELKTPTSFPNPS